MISIINKKNVDTKKVSEKASLSNSKKTKHTQTNPAVKKYLIAIEPNTNLLKHFHPFFIEILTTTNEDRAFIIVKTNANNIALSILFQYLILPIL